MPTPVNPLGVRLSARSNVCSVLPKQRKKLLGDEWVAIDTGFEPVFRGRQPRALTSELIDRWRSGVPLRKNAALQAVASTINAEKLDQFAAAVYAALAESDFPLKRLRKI